MPERAPIRLVLASASPARLRTLRAAGVDPQVVVSAVDEDAALEAVRASGGRPTPAQVSLLLARAKAEEVAERLSRGEAPPHLVLGCDSVLEQDGEAHGKPADAVTAHARWTRMSGNEGVLHTGHWLVDLRPRRPLHPGGQARHGWGDVASTTVWFAALDDTEIGAYVATGEPLAVAGAFTVDGLGGPFVERIEGDHHNVVGVSLPLLRRLLSTAGLHWYDVRGASTDS